MIRKALNSAFETGSDVLIFLRGFPEAFKGRVQDIDDEYFSLLQSSKSSSVLLVFQLKDVLSCGLLLAPPTGYTEPGSQEKANENTVTVADPDKT
jgi:hypothetical protein